MDTNVEAFEWACDHLDLEINDEDHCAEIAEELEADIIRFGPKVALRDDEDRTKIWVWDPDTDEWTREDDRLVEILKELQLNPLRLHQEGYLSRFGHHIAPDDGLG